MGKARAGSNAYKAVQQKIAGGMDIVTRIDGTPAPSKAELRASIPDYDPSMIKRVETGKKTIKKKT